MYRSRVNDTYVWRTCTGVPLIMFRVRHACYARMHWGYGKIIFFMSRMYDAIRCVPACANEINMKPISYAQWNILSKLCVVVNTSTTNRFFSSEIGVTSGLQYAFVPTHTKEMLREEIISLSTLMQKHTSI